MPRHRGRVGRYHNNGSVLLIVMPVWFSEGATPPVIGSFRSTFSFVGEALSCGMVLMILSEAVVPSRTIWVTLFPSAFRLLAFWRRLGASAALVRDGGASSPTASRRGLAMAP